MGDIFLKEMKPVFGQSLITVTQVRITPDLSIARIYVSLMMIGGGTKEELLELKKLADEKNISYYLVIDAGRTQIPTSSVTVLALGPDEDKIIDEVTGDLKLL